MEEFRPQTPEIKPENLGSILDGREAKDLLDSMRRFEFASGEIVLAGTDKGIGYKDHNEDRVAVSIEHNSAMVADGVGGHPGGALVAETFCKRFLESPTDIDLAIAQTLEDTEKPEMEAGVKHGATVFISARVVTESRGKFLEVFQRGDSRVFVIKKDGRVIFESIDETIVQGLIDMGAITPEQALSHPYRNVITNSVSIDKKGQKTKTYPLIPVESGDVVFLMSDGISGNVTAGEISKKVKEGWPSEEIFAWISQVTNEKMEHVGEVIENTDGLKRRGKKDNRALVIMEIK